MFVTLKTHYDTCAALQRAEAALSERDRTIERMELDHDRLRASYEAVVALMGNMAARPVPQVKPWQNDPFEESKGPNVYLTPDPAEFPDMDILIQRIEDTTAKELGRG